VWYLSLPLAGVAAQFHRYRRSVRAAERQQVKWVVFGVAGIIVLVSASQALPLLFPPNQASEQARVSLALVGMLLWNVAVVLVPLSIGVATLRYRLWDTDIVINRSLVCGSLTTVVIGLYVCLVGLISAIFQARDDVNTAPNPVLALAVTGLIAVVVDPLRRRLQRAVNRLMYGNRDEPYVAVSRLRDGSKPP